MSPKTAVRYGLGMVPHYWLVMRVVYHWQKVTYDKTGKGRSYVIMLVAISRLMVDCYPSTVWLLLPGKNPKMVGNNNHTHHGLTVPVTKKKK